MSYKTKLAALQSQLNEVQHRVRETGSRVVILFEGRDTAGKSGCIRRFMQHVNSRYCRVVALPAPTEKEKTQWYFQRYVRHLPSAGEIVLFDRSWYNRAIVEPVNGFCTEDQYKDFMLEVGDFENMITKDGIILLKFYFNISKETQKKRLEKRSKNPLKKWRMGEVDMKAYDLWDTYDHYENNMLLQSDNSSDWLKIDANNKKVARLDALGLATFYINHSLTKKII